MIVRRGISRGSTAFLTKAFVKALGTNGTTSLPFPSIQSVNFGTRRRSPISVKKPVEASSAPAPQPKDPWVAVKDEASGQVYWWNQDTDETTVLGAPKPTGPDGMTPPPPGHSGGQVAPQQQGSMMGGIGGMIAEGMAFGVGSSIARHAVGSVFDSFSGGDSSSAPPIDDGSSGFQDGSGSGDGNGGEQGWGETWDGDNANDFSNDWEDGGDDDDGW